MLNRTTSSGIAAVLACALLANETNKSLSLIQLRNETGSGMDFETDTIDITAAANDDVKVQQFLLHEAHVNRQLTNNSEFESRLGNFLKTDATVSTLNSKHAEKGLHFSHNQYSDQSDAERLGALGGRDENSEHVNATLAQAKLDTEAWVVECTSYVVPTATCQITYYDCNYEWHATCPVGQWEDYYGMCNECDAACSQDGCDGPTNGACYACAPGHVWEGTYCVPEQQQGDDGKVFHEYQSYIDGWRDYYASQGIVTDDEYYVMLCNKYGSCSCEEQASQMCYWWGGWYCDSQQFCDWREPKHPKQPEIDAWREYYANYGIVTDAEYYQHLQDWYDLEGCAGVQAAMCDWWGDSYCAENWCPNADIPEGNTPDDNTPDDNTPDDNTPDDNTPDDNTPDDSTPDDSTPDDSTPDDTTPDDDDGIGPVSPFDQIADDEMGCVVDSNAVINWDEDYCTPVTDQGSCGSCWAQSGADVATYWHYITTGELYEVSRQQLVDCDTEVSGGCNGGVEFYAFNYIAEHGAAYHRDYAYSGKDENCDTTQSTKHILSSGYNEIIGQSWGLNEANPKQTLIDGLQNGPMTIAVNVDDAFFAYQSGIMTHEACTGANNTSINHAVVLTGYGTNGDCGGRVCDYFIVKNSWGTNWGADGYIKIEAEEGGYVAGVCGLYTRAAQPYMA